MPTLKGLYQDAQKGGGALVVTGPHTRWIETPEADRKITPEAALFVHDALLGKFKHGRGGRFSPSGIAGCPRRSLFGFAGAPEVGENPDSQDLMGLGTWGHLRWQAEGISQGWMVEAEVWTWDPHYRIGGSIDGLLHDWSLFELKTVTGQKFTRIVSVEQQPLHEHRLQFQAYKHTEGVADGSVVYETRERGAYHEFRLEADDLLERELVIKLEKLNNHVEDDTLPPMLDDCELRRGDTYRQCPFRKWCPKVNSLFGPVQEHKEKQVA